MQRYLDWEFCKTATKTPDGFCRDYILQDLRLVTPELSWLLTKQFAICLMQSHTTCISPLPRVLSLRGITAWRAGSSKNPPPMPQDHSLAVLLRNYPKNPKQTTTNPPASMQACIHTLFKNKKLKQMFLP